MDFLVDGCIPAGKTCPFLKDCGFKFEACPTPANLKDKDFSCAAARLHTAILRPKK